VELSGIKWNQVEPSGIADCPDSSGRIADLMDLADDMDGVDGVDGVGGWVWIASRHGMA
jgi:hypothetical protein